MKQQEVLTLFLCSLCYFSSYFVSFFLVKTDKVNESIEKIRLQLSHNKQMHFLINHKQQFESIFNVSQNFGIKEILRERKQKKKSHRPQTIKGRATTNWEYFQSLSPIPPFKIYQTSFSEETTQDFGYLRQILNITDPSQKNFKAKDQKNAFAVGPSRSIDFPAMTVGVWVRLGSKPKAENIQTIYSNRLFGCFKRNDN